MTDIQLLEIVEEKPKRETEEKNDFFFCCILRCTLRDVYIAWEDQPTINSFNYERLQIKRSSDGHKMLNSQQLILKRLIRIK